MWLATTGQRVLLLVILPQILIIWIFYYRGMLMHNGSPYYETKLDTTNLATSSRSFTPSNVTDASSAHQTILSKQHTPAKESQDSANITELPSDNIGYKTKIAIGLGLTTRKTSVTDLRRIPFFRSLMTSFCKTASGGYDYHFFVAYDYNDAHLSRKSFLDHFEKSFVDFTKQNCPRSSAFSIHFILCSHERKPAWAQNDAMIEAYLAGMEYFYRINDDTVIQTKKWTERFIGTLEKFTPPQIGVVGPTHSGGNTVILTYDFTHRTHIEINGFYYPREFADWYADRWITYAYKPGRSVKLPDIHLKHTMEVGQRYRNSIKTGPQVDDQIQKAREKIIRYAIAKEEGIKKPTPKKVVAISLYNSSAADCWGVVRNAQLMPIIYPGWTLHVYTSRRLIGRGPLHVAVSSSFISDRVMNTLELLGAKVIYVDEVQEKELPPQLWSYLVADKQGIDVFLIRPTEQRLAEREVAVVKHWIAGKGPQTVHCIKDHPKHSNRTLMDGLWGAKAKDLHSLLGDTSMEQLIKTHAKEWKGDQSEIVTHLENVLYEKVKKNIIFYDSINCQKPDSRPFPIKRKDAIYVGEKFDAHEQPVLNEKYEVLKNTNRKCDGI